MKHKFEDTEGFEGECLICCKSEAEHILPPQVYQGMYVIPLYCEREVHANTRKHALTVIEHLVMFGGRM